MPLLAVQAQGREQAALPGAMLARVHVSAVDDQHLFELNVRLQYAEEEEALLHALNELSGATVLDFAPEALLQRPALLDSVLDIASAGVSLATPRARRLSLQFLRTLVSRAKEALVDAADAGLLPRYTGVRGRAHLLKRQLQRMHCVAKRADTNAGTHFN